MYRALPRQKKTGVRRLGEPQPTHLPEQFLRVSQCSYFLHFLALENQRHSSPQAVRTWQWVLLSAARSQGLSSPPGCALVAQLP